MDHLSHMMYAKKRTIKFALEYSKRIEYDWDVWYEFPHRCGLVFESITTSEGISQNADILQEWLFFGVLYEFSQTFHVALDLNDFIQTDETGTRVITTRKLPMYLWLWAASEAARRWYDERKAPSNGDPGSPLQLPAGQLIEDRSYPEETHFNRLIRYLLGSAGAAITHLSGVELRSSSPGHPVMIPIVLLYEFLQLTARILQGGHTERLGGCTPKALTDRALEAGWCPGQINTLKASLDPSCFSLLAVTEKRPDGKDHGGCLGDICNAFQIDEATYVTKHVENGCNCSHYVDPDIDAKVADSLDNDKLPVVAVNVSDSNEVDSVEVHDAESIPRYVAISHVWSDGMGNVKGNTLPRCILASIQAKIQKMFPDEPKPVPFWIDTICVPREKTLRNKAIRAMARTYSDAEAVLVMDQSLQELARPDTHEDMVHGFYASPPERLIYSRICPWTTRLWTFQEAWLAKTLHFDFADRSFDEHELFYSWAYFRHAPMLFDTEMLMSIQDIENADPDSGTTIPTRFLRIILARGLIKAHDMDNLMYRDLDVDMLRQKSQEWEDAALQGASEASRRALFDDSQAYRLAKWMVSFPSFDPVLVYDAARLLNDVRIAKETQPKETLVATVLAGLRGRTTSHVADEAICVASVLGLDPLPLAQERDATKRMRLLLKTIGEVPKLLIFSPNEHLTDEGFRWAPRSFMHQKYNILSVTDSATVTDEGLVGKFPGLRLHFNQDLSQESNLIAIRVEDASYYVVLLRYEGPSSSHDSWTDYQSSNMALVFWPDPRDDMSFEELDGEVVETSSIDTVGALVSLDGADGDVWKARYCKPVLFKRFMHNNARRTLVGHGEWMEGPHKWCIS